MGKINHTDDNFVVPSGFGALVLILVDTGGEEGGKEGNEKNEQTEQIGQSDHTEQIKHIRQIE